MNHAAVAAITASKRLGLLTSLNAIRNCCFKYSICKT